MTTRLVGLTPQTATKIAGVLYLIIIARRMLAKAFVREQVIVKNLARVRFLRQKGF